MSEPGDDSPFESDPVAGPDSTEPGPPLRAPTWTEVVGLANDAFTASNHWLLATDKLHVAIHVLGIDPNDAALGPLRTAMRFLLREVRGPQAEVSLSYFDLPGGGVLTPKSVKPETRDGWRRLSTALTHPAARARLFDLLWQTGGTSVLADCGAALDAYLEVAALRPYRLQQPGSEGGPMLEAGEIEWQRHDRDLALGRALTISHVASRAEAGAKSAARSREIGLSRLDEYLGDARPNAGNTLLLLALLVRQRRLLSDDQRAALNRSLEAALSKYAAQDYLVDELAELLIRLLPGQRSRAQRLRVKARLAIADDRPQPAVKMHFLERAAALARDFRIEDLRVEATRRMQAIKWEDLGLQTFRSETELPWEAAQADVLRMCEGATWREALRTWLLSPSPTGSVEEWS